MRWGVFPSCFLSSPGSSFSIQCHVHLPPIVLPVKGCICVISIFLYPLLQLTVIVKFFLQGKNKIFYSCDDDTYFHLTQTIQRTPVQEFPLLLPFVRKLCPSTEESTTEEETRSHKIDSVFEGSWFILIDHHNHKLGPF